MQTNRAAAIHDAFHLSADAFLTRDTFRERKRTSCQIDRHPAVLASIASALQDPTSYARSAMRSD